MVSLVSMAAHASVTMVGTRVIYVASSKEQGLRFANPDTYPNLVQIWFDRGNPLARSEIEDSPFVATPPMFRIEPDSAQVVRLSYVGEDLPTDRESLFFLNFLQVPALKASAVNANQLVLTVRSRLKVFYRPTELAGSQDMSHIYQSLNLSEGGQAGARELIARNDSGYFIVVERASLVRGDEESELATGVLIAPMGTISLPLAKGAAQLDQATVRMKIIDDYGGEAVYDYPIH